MGDFDQVQVEALSFFARARKAVVAAVAAGIATGTGVLTTAILSSGFSTKALGAAAAAGIGAAGVALRVTYQAKPNEPSLDVPPKRSGEHFGPTS